MSVQDVGSSTDDVTLERTECKAEPELSSNPANANTMSKIGKLFI